MPLFSFFTAKKVCFVSFSFMNVELILLLFYNPCVLGQNLHYLLRLYNKRKPHSRQKHKETLLGLREKVFYGMECLDNIASDLFSRETVS